MPALKPCLWFPSEAEEAAQYYVSLFPGSRIVDVVRAGGGVVAVDFVLDGQAVTALNGRHERGFTDAVSMIVPCASQTEVDRYWDALADGGEPGSCGWLTDRFGVSWQIVPRELPGLLGDPDPARAGRVLQAMLAMQKLDVGVLHRARDAEALPQTA